MKIGPRKLRVALVMQNAWDRTLLTMPLALGYLKSFAMADDDIRENFDIELWNYSRRASVSQMALDLFEDPPDIIGFSVLGWNYQNFGQLTETFAQVNPQGWAIFGGNHASYQAQRVFRMFPDVDLIVNGEGEITFRELLKAFLAGRKKEELHEIEGLSIHCEDGKIITTPERPRIKDLDTIPSPFLTGAIPLRGPGGEFLYDVALMETNRGCPYQCAFCYWGGATGQKLSRFSQERVQAELDYFVENKVEHIALCDANFGMLKEDLEFVEHMIKLRAESTYPRSFVTSWAKNKSSVFYEIVRRLKATGFHSDLTLSLQTLNGEALQEMRRKNMQVNDFDDLCNWLQKEGMSVHVELIWGVPGETVASFIEGYDRLAEWHTRIATYPLCILPNTAYSDNRNKYNMVTVRDTASDFEFVLSHDTISIKDNRRMHHFLFWARLTAEYQILRHIFRPLHLLAGLKQSEVALTLDSFFENRTDAASEGLRVYLRSVVDSFDITRITAAVIYIHRNVRAFEPILLEWWKTVIAPRVPVELRHFFEDLFRYDCATRPRFDAVLEAEGTPMIELDGQRFYGPVTHRFDHDIPSVLSDLRNGVSIAIERRPWEVELYYRAGFTNVADSHEFVVQYSGRTLASIEEEAEARKSGMIATAMQPHEVGLGRMETPALALDVPRTGRLTLQHF